MDGMEDGEREERVLCVLYVGALERKFLLRQYRGNDRVVYQKQRAGMLANLALVRLVASIEEIRAMGTCQTTF